MTRAEAAFGISTVFTVEPMPQPAPHWLGSGILNR
jgi:hypothetical protein